MWSLEERGAIYRETLRLNAEQYHLEQQALAARRDRKAQQPPAPRLRLRLPAWLRPARPPVACSQQFHDPV